MCNVKTMVDFENSIAQGLNLYENFHAAFGAAAKFLPTGQYSPKILSALSFR